MESGEVKLKSSDSKIFEVPIDILQIYWYKKKW